ncbi:ABC transporter permease [Vibrio tritonius]|uniref:ABC transporter permease n=1 Tax=Vibrio tritonius TaxID=1435069 RepID=UPI0008386B3D|nr:sugar ABC transporter permease [Vibrio tritonius]
MNENNRTLALLILPALVVIGCFFVYPLGYSIYSGLTDVNGMLTGQHLVKAIDFYGKDMLFTAIIVIVSIACILVLSVGISALVTLSPFQGITKLLGALYRIPLFIPFIVTAQMMRTFLAKNGLMNNGLVELGILTPFETVSFLGWKGIIITFIWKQLAFATLLIAGAMAAIEADQTRAARNLGANRWRILWQILLPQIKTTIAVAMVLSLVSIMSVLSVPMMIGTGTPTMLSADMAFRINSYSDYPVANALGIISYCMTGLFSWFYLRQSTKQESR